MPDPEDFRKKLRGNLRSPRDPVISTVEPQGEGVSPAPEPAREAARSFKKQLQESLGKVPIPETEVLPTGRLLMPLIRGIPRGIHRPYRSRTDAEQAKDFLANLPAEIKNLPAKQARQFLDDLEVAGRPFAVGAETVAGIVHLYETLGKKVGVPERAIDPLKLSSPVLLEALEEDVSPSEFWNESLAAFENRPWYQELGLAAATDPLNVLGAPGLRLAGKGLGKIPGILGGAPTGGAPTGGAPTMRHQLPLFRPLTPISEVPPAIPSIPPLPEQAIASPPRRLLALPPSRSLAAMPQPPHTPKVQPPIGSAIPSIPPQIVPSEGMIPGTLSSPPRTLLALPPPVRTSPTGALLDEPGTIGSARKKGPVLWFREWLTDPKRVEESNLTKKWMTEERRQRGLLYEQRVKDLVHEGIDKEEAMSQATEVLKGQMTRPQFAMMQFAEPEIRQSLYDEIYNAGLPPFEMLATKEALSSALAGGSISRVPGIKGGSAYSRLLRVFGTEITDKLSEKGDLNHILTHGEVTKGVRPKFPEGQYAGTDEPFDLALEFPPVERASDVIRRKPIWFREVPNDPRTAYDKEMDFRMAWALQKKGEVTWAATGPGARGDEPLRDFGSLTPEKLLDEWNSLLEQGWSNYSIASHFRRFPEGPPPGPFIGPKVPRMSGNIPPDDGATMVGLWGESAKERAKRWAKYFGLTVMDVGNLIRANVATVDLSYLRQQAFLIPGHMPTFAKSFKDALRAVWSDDYALKIDNAIKSDPDFALYYDQLGLDFLRPLGGKTAKAWEVAEEYMILGPGDRPLQWLANHLPWITISHRAYVTGINKMNYDLFKAHLRMMNRISDDVGAGRLKMKPGEVVDINGAMKAYGKMLGLMSGRGPLGPLKEWSPALNAGLFSVRLQIGRILSPFQMVSPDRYTRKAAIYNFSTAISSMTGIILAGKYMGWWDAELDVRSSDFGKIKIGRKRIDIFGGYQQYLVLYARILTGDLKSTSDGQVMSAYSGTTVARFTESKISPGLSQTVSAWFERDFRGAPIDRTDWKFWLERNTPMSLVDWMEGFEDAGLIGVGISAPLSTGGMGVNVHDLSKQDISLELDYGDYFDLPLESVQRKEVDYVWKTRLTRAEQGRIDEAERRNKKRSDDREKKRLAHLRSILDVDDNSDDFILHGVEIPEWYEFAGGAKK